MDKAYLLEEIERAEQHRLYAQLLTQNINKHDSLAFIIYIVMLECGFTRDATEQVHTYNHAVLAAQSYDPGVLNKANNVYGVTLFINKIKCNLTMLIQSDSLIVNLWAPEYKLLRCDTVACIDFTNYVQLRQVCLRFKNNFSVPMRTLLLSESCVYLSSLLGMPFDIWMYLVKCIGFRDFIALSRTCKLLHAQLGEEQSVWLHFCKRAGLVHVNDNPKEVLKKYYSRRKLEIIKNICRRRAATLLSRYSQMGYL